jgi:hypothetical protein
VPDYAKPIWDLGAAYGALSGRGPQKAARRAVFDIGSTVTWRVPQKSMAVRSGPLITASPRAELLKFVRKLEPKYGLSGLEKATRRAQLKALGYSDAQLAQMGY